jgi:hypothetical protein
LNISKRFSTKTINTSKYLLFKKKLRYLRLNKAFIQMLIILNNARARCP